MSFLFKKNKPATQPPASGLPQASRPIHTSDGTPAPVKPTTTPESDDRIAQSPPPNTGANSSIDSLTKNGAPISQQQVAPQNPAPFARRDRAGSELGVGQVLKDEA